MTFVSITFCQPCSGVASGAAPQAVPALLTRMSMRPNAACVSSTSRATSSALATLHAVPWQATPCARVSSAAAAAQRSPFRPHTVTFAPRSARAPAICLPRPVAPPVTMAARAREVEQVADAHAAAASRRRLARLVAQDVLLHLARRGLRQRLDDLERLRHLVAREPRARHLAQVVGRDVGPVAQHDVGLRHLAPELVGHADHGDLDDRGVGGERVLDLDARDVLAAGDDDVLQAVADLDVAVGMHHAEIAGAEPPARRTPRPSPPRRGSSRRRRCCRA